MLATKNPARWLFTISFAAALVILTGCTASGPRALLDGDRALRDGKLPRAVEKLKRATELMPDEPRAWNLLGVAYHYSGQPQAAAHAYAQALKRDRSNLVAVAHFNLGCLLLEQGNAAAAADELRSFTMTTNSALAWLKLGEAQSRLRQFDAAERSFGNALRMQQKELQPLAWNGLAVVSAQRNRTRDAFAQLNTALASNPKFAPALLNAAVLGQLAGSRQYALQRYQDYLAASPGSANAEAVRALVHYLDRELAPKPVAVVTNVAPAVVTRTNVAAPLVATNAPIIATAPTPRPVASNPPTTRTPVTSVAAPVAPRADTSVAARKPAVTNPAPASVPITMVAVAPSTPVVVAASTPAAARNVTSTNAAPAPLVTAPPVVINDAPAERPSRGGILQRLNPFRSRPEAPSEPARTVVVSPPGPAAPASASSAAAKSFARYQYVNPGAPKAGNRAEAERAFAQGAKAHRAGSNGEALLAYEQAVAADPSFIDAQYNRALLTQQSGKVKQSLPLWETVLALEPDSINARYNFALALKQAEFPHDAAAELERIIEAKPSEARAHLTLANVCAQQLGDTRRAREHYLKLLELEPRNTQASAIRFWLAANP